VKALKVKPGLVLLDDGAARFARARGYQPVENAWTGKAADEWATHKLEFEATKSAAEIAREIRAESRGARVTCPTPFKLLLNDTATHVALRLGFKPMESKKWKRWPWVICEIRLEDMADLVVEMISDYADTTQRT